MRTLLLLLFLSQIVQPLSSDSPQTIQAENAAARITVSAQSETVYPNSTRQVRVQIQLKERISVWAVVVIVPLRSPIDVNIESGNGSCEQPGDPRSGAVDWLSCRFFNPPPGSAISLTVTMLRPAGIVTNPITAACSTPPMAIGTPITVAVNGEKMLDQAMVWSPYQPGYCVFLPTVAR
jgi:hypothetical protein